jgi:hypothetical protein
MHRAGCYQGIASQSAGCAVMFSAMHSAHLYQLSCNNTAKPTKSCPIKKIDACRMLTAPRANGLFFVLSTARSRRASHMSLIVHPAPRMTTAPVKNRAIFQRGSKGEGSGVIVRADSVMDQAARKVEDVSLLDLDVKVKCLLTTGPKEQPGADGFINPDEF